MMNRDAGCIEWMRLSGPLVKIVSFMIKDARGRLGTAHSLSLHTNRQQPYNNLDLECDRYAHLLYMTHFTVAEGLRWIVAVNRDNLAVFHRSILRRQLSVNGVSTIHTHRR